METSTFIWLALIGLISGVVSGLLGIGGAVIIIPSLVYLIGMNQQDAQGTSLAMMLLPVGIFAVWQYYSAGHINIKFAGILAIFFMAGAYFGSKMALNISQDFLKKAFGVLLLMVSVKMIFWK